MLDLGTTHPIIANEKLLTDISVSKNPIRMSTNASDKLIDKEGQLLGAGRVYHDPECIANPLSLGKLSDSYRITMDTWKDNAFYVHMESGKIRFGRGANNYYLNKPSLKRVESMKKSEAVSNVSTLQDNMEGFSQREI